MNLRNITQSTLASQIFGESDEQLVDDNFIKQYCEKVRSEINKNKNSGSYKSEKNKKAMKKKKHKEQLYNKYIGNKSQNTSEYSAEIHPKSQFTDHLPIKKQKSSLVTSHRQHEQTAKITAESKQKQKTSFRQKWLSQNKKIDYVGIFEEAHEWRLCLYESVEAGFIYKEILEELVLYVMAVKLELKVILSDLEKNQQNNHQTRSETNTSQVPVAFNEQSDSNSYNIVVGQGNKMYEHYNTNQFERILERLQSFTLKKLINQIPYKSISSLFIIPYLNFLIKHSQQLLKLPASYLKTLKVCSQELKKLKKILIKNKTYLIEEKLKKNLRNTEYVEKKFKQIFGNFYQNSFKNQPQNSVNSQGSTNLKHEQNLSEK